MASVDLPVSHIFTRLDARKIDRAAVRGLIDSISDVGLINPLRVRPARRFVQGFEADAWEATAGAHRLEAVRALNFETVACIVVEDDDLHAELAMIDENLMRADLDPAQRAKQTARRKAIYLELHPETDKSQNGSNFRLQSEVPSFVEDAAEKTGKHRTTIWRDADRGENISPEILDKVSGTALNTGVYLDALKKLDPEKQRAKVDRDLRRVAEERAAKSSARKRSLSDAEVMDRQVGALMTAWNKASPEAREEFLSRIDTPVFDQTKAA